jgi:hypothetical protein
MCRSGARSPLDSSLGVVGTRPFWKSSTPEAGVVCRSHCNAPALIRELLMEDSGGGDARGSHRRVGCGQRGPPAGRRRGVSQLPDGAKRVLTEVGLPREADLQFTRSDPEWVMAADGVHKYCKIGSDYGTEICIVTDSGVVFSLSSSGRHQARFVNSGLEHFVEFLCRVTVARRRLLGLADEEADAQVEGLEAELRARDPRAFSTPNRWWSVIFEQMKAGLL